ncbi:MAG: tRNA uracil 4-sulfurtransferase ThiI [Coprococcus sp.]
MQYKAFMIKYAEIGTKGKNRYIFEDILCKNINRKLKSLGEFHIRKEQGRIFVEARSDYDYEDTIAALTKVFGIVGICPVIVEEDTSFETIRDRVIEYVDNAYDRKNFTFKVNTRRNDKTYPMTSMEVNAELGHYLLEAYDKLSVDVHTPQEIINVEIRKVVYIYSITIPGPGGLPVGTNGKAMALLSGGIDSPVAAYMIAKRGVEIEAVYFHAPPFTSERAKQKVVDLACIVADYAGAIRLHVVNFADIQMAIYDNCPHEELTIIMKRYMIKIAEELAKRNDCQCTVTGESIGQVSSQTVHSLYVINEVSTMPVFRPCIGMDKQEIVDISEKIGTYETSIQPYEDCCTTFVAKHPVTKPILSAIEKSESKLAGIIEPMVEKAVDTVETIMCRNK